MVAPTPMQPTPQQVIAAQAAYGPSAGLAFQRSQYLAEALANLQQTSSQNVRSPAQMWANIASNAILGWSKHKADQQAMQAYQADSASQEHHLFDGTPADPNAQPQSGPAPAPAQASPSSPSPGTGPTLAAALSGAPQAQPGPPPTPTGPMSDPDKLNLARMVWGEARGEPPLGQQAVASVALNRAKSTGQSLADILSAPHQFQGYNDTAKGVPASQLADILQNIAPALNGQDPTGGAKNFLNPALLAQEGGATPSWAQGQGLPIGHHVFYGGSPQMAQNGPIPGPPPGAMAAGGNPQPVAVAPPPGAGVPAPAAPAAPYQVAANGPTPPPPGAPQMPPNGPAPPPPAMAMGSSALGAPVGAPPAAVPPPAAGVPPQGIPHQLTTPEQWQYAKQLYEDPRTRQEGIALAQKLHLQQISPVAAPEKMMWNAQTGRVQPIPGTETTQLPGASPSDAPQRDAFGNITHSTVPGVQGSVPEGMVLGPNGTYAKVPTQAPQTFRLPGVAGTFVQGPNGQPTKVADDAVTPKDLQTSRDSWRNSDDVKKANEGIAAYNGLASTIQRMAGNNGVLSTAAVDSYLRGINPGMGARNTTVTMFLNHLGLPTEIKSWVQSNVDSNGYLTPQTLNQMLTVIRSYAGAHSEIAQRMANSDLTALSAQGVPVSADQLGENLTPFAPPPKVQWLNDGPQAQAADPIVQTPAGPMHLSQVRAIAAQKGQGR